MRKLTIYGIKIKTKKIIKTLNVLGFYIFYFDRSTESYSVLIFCFGQNDGQIR